MPVNVPANAPYLRRLVCAYTGRPADIRMISDGRMPALYLAAAAFDPTNAGLPTPEALFRALGTRDGVEGAARDGAELLCPYTGAVMTPVNIPGIGWCATGGFSPSTPQDSPEGLARGLMSRGGVVPDGAPVRARVAVSAPVPPPEAVDTPAITRDDALAEAERFLKDRLPVRTSVTVPRGAPRRKRG